MSLHLVWAVMLASVLLCMARNGWAQDTVALAKCRASLAKGVKKLADTTLKERARCHRQRMRGQLGQGVDCNDPNRSPTSLKVIAAGQRLVKTASRCSRAGAPAAGGYVVCPAPCANTAIGDYAALATCFGCLTEAAVDAAIEETYATPPLRTLLSDCQDDIGGALRRYAVARFEQQRRCQLSEDLKPAGRDCRSDDASGRIAAAVNRANSTIASCTEAALAALNSCAIDITGEQACVRAAAETLSDILFDAIYDPPPAPPTPTETATRTRTATATADLTPTPTETAPPTDTPLPTATATNPPPIHLDYNEFPPDQADAPCLIFVHGKRTTTGSYTDWNQARSYWIDGANDFVRSATRNFSAPYYVVGYNGTQPYWEAQAAGEVASEIVNATNGGDDGGGNHCAQTYAQGGRFLVVAHSMGPAVMDYILGNASPSDPNYNKNGPYDVAAQRIGMVISIAGTHRGSQGADYVCGSGNPFCTFFAQFIQDCDGATSWLRSSDDVQVKNYASPPSRTTWLTGGYKAIPGASLCLAGEDDGVVQYASIFACGGSATAGYDNVNVCHNGNKQEAFGFKNLDAGHENHDESRNDKNRGDRRAIPSGAWICNGSSCLANSEVQGSTSTAELVGMLY